MVLDGTLNLFTWILFVTITIVYNLIWMPEIFWGPMVWGPILTILDNPPRMMLNKVMKCQECSLKSSKVNFILVRVAFTYLKATFLYGYLSFNVFHLKSFFIIFYIYLPNSGIFHGLIVFWILISFPKENWMRISHMKIRTWDGWMQLWLLLCIG